MKCTMESINAEWTKQKEKICELEDRNFEIIQSEENKKKE